MKYVEKIEIDGTSVDGYMSDGDLDGVSILVDGVRIFSDDIRKCAALGVFSGDKVALLRYDKVRAKLEDYVFRVHTKDNGSVPHSADCIMFGLDWYVPYYMYNKSETLYIVDKDGIFQIYGSVARMKVGDKYQLCTIYDLLVMIIRKSRRNIMSYDNIHIVGAGHKNKTEIYPHHTTESSRYFTKMLML